ncbi:PEP motif putative anchor domain protein (plasmid) [Gemmatirosa kalamazoonensis]|uniref:PEP motif putative anchor domain protein n=1 Tax=Gemmatirosa kalamazoonensis TaxID=861299 RepID=W0RQ23_9BACT|nr:PEP-CTERM sorting domain-containing protein [Gemmatirosa kalamazoonensis]AHG92582.1 PEP motif putative anchor domain protein [Gemmatirosa kalamazoonensis]
MPRHRNRWLAHRRVLGVAVLALGPRRASAQRTQSDAHVTFTPSAAVTGFTYDWSTWAFARPGNLLGTPNSRGRIDVPGDQDTFAASAFSQRFRPSGGEAHSRADVDLAGVLTGPPYDISLLSSAESNGGEASEAHSTLTALGGASLLHGTISWGPSVFGSGGLLGLSSPGAGVGAWAQDPATQATTYFAPFLSMESANWGGQVTWDSNTGLFAVNAKQMTFSLRMSSPFTSVNGLFEFTIFRGQVTQLTHTGIFASMPFHFASPGSFTTTLAPIEFDYAVPDPSGGADPVDAGAYFFASSGAATITPEPSTLVLLGSGMSLLLVAGVRRRRAGRTG